MAVNAQKKAGRPRGEGLIDVPRIVQAAWAIVDRDGIAGLSTRTLASALNVKSPALYWHVRNKEALLSLMVEAVIQDSLLDIDPNLDWADWLKEVARRQRRLLLAHRDSGSVTSIAPPTERMRTELFPQMMDPLLASGLPPEFASAVTGGIAALVLGWVINEQRPEKRDFVLAFHDPEIGFEIVLDAFVRGIANPSIVKRQADGDKARR